MKFPKLPNFKKKNLRKRVDFYQNSIEKNGRDQIERIVEKGLSFPVFVL